MNSTSSSEDLFKIEMGIPMPPPKQKYPFHKMDVGDSFRIPPEYKKRVGAAAVMYSRGRDVKFALRDTRLEIRLWRIK